MSATKYDRIAARKNHSDTLYHNLLNTFLTHNFLFATGAGLVLKYLSEARDCWLLLGISSIALLINLCTDRFLRAQTRYQQYLQDYFDSIRDEFKDLPEIFDRNEEYKNWPFFDRWSRITRVISYIWYAGIFVSIGAATRIYYG